MAGIAGRPFLDLLLRQLSRYGIQRIILATGHGSEVIESYFGTSALGMSLQYSVESEPLGTGGALRNATGLLGTEDVLVMNGDSYTDVDLAALAATHHAAGADVTMVVVPGEGRTDGGSVSAAADGRMTGFNEKREVANGRGINAGIYVIRKQLLLSIPDHMQISLEKEVLPRWLAEGREMRIFLHTGSCVDIGTPERFEKAQTVLAVSETEAGVVNK